MYVCMYCIIQKKIPPKIIPDKDLTRFNRETLRKNKVRTMFGVGETLSKAPCPGQGSG